jgi:hypothetical protein
LLVQATTRSPEEGEKVREACFCGRVGEIEDREPVSLDGGERALRHGALREKAKASPSTRRDMNGC